MTQLKVALVSEDFPPFRSGGVATVCEDLARNLSKRDVSVTVICGTSGKMTREKLNDFLEIIRLPCLDLPPRFVWFQLENFCSLTSLLEGCDIVHGVSPEASSTSAYLSARLRKPMLVSIHDVPLFELRMFVNSPLSTWSIGDFGYCVLEYPLTHTMRALSLRQADHVVSCSVTLLGEIRTAYGDLKGDSVSVVYNGIDFDKIARIVDDPTVQPGQCDSSIVFCGRLYWRKGITYLLDAFSNVLESFPETKLNIFGSGPLGGKIHRYVSKHGLRDSITVHGHVPYSKLILAIKNATIVVLPYLYEGQPIAALEAMACGKPLIAFDFPFAREFIRNNENGLLARGRDVRDLSEKITLLLSDSNLRSRIGTNAQSYVRVRHNWDKIVQDYIGLYERCIDDWKTG